MDLRKLEIFAAVAEHCSFSEAAKQLHMAQPAVSIAVRKLEETLESFQQLATTLNTTLNKFNESESSLNKLMSEDSLYDNLNKTLVDLDSLLNHMNQYPKHFFAPLGKKRKKIVKEMEN